MIDLLIKKFEVKTKFSKQGKDLLKKHVVFKRYERGEQFLEVENSSNEIGFVLSGIFRSYLPGDAEGVEDGTTTIEFIGKDGCVTNFLSFTENNRSDFGIECLVAGELAIITKAAWEIFEQEIPEWNNTINYIRSRYLLELQNFQREILNQDALACYRCFCEKFPNIVHNVPLGHVASFLGITQSTLSRIRKKDFNH